MVSHVLFAMHSDWVWEGHTPRVELWTFAELPEGACPLAGVATFVVSD